MPDHEKSDHDRPSTEDAVKRVLALSDGDEDDLIHTVLAAGEDDTYWYYIVILEREYQGNDYLNERYVQLAKPDTGRDDSYKKNGINRRVDDVLNYAAALSGAYERIAQREARFQSGSLTSPDGLDVLFLDTHDRDSAPNADDFEEP